MERSQAVIAKDIVDGLNEKAGIDEVRCTTIVYEPEKYEYYLWILYDGEKEGLIYYHRDRLYNAQDIAEYSRYVAKCIVGESN